jgi:tetratricopeptide (TPR) repeat protein
MMLLSTPLSSTSLALECRITVLTERERIATNISGPLRILSQIDEGGDGGIEALLKQLDVSAGGERESLRAAYRAVLRYDSEVRKDIAQALNEATIAQSLALAAAIAREPNNPEGHATRAAILDHMGRHEDALDSFDTAINLGPDAADLQLGRGLALSSLERETEALTSFDRALKLNPNLPEPHYWRAIILLSSERPDGEVLAELEEALRLGFTNPTALSAVQDLLEGDAAVEFRHLVDRCRTPRIE